MLIWLAVILYFVPAVNALLRGHKNAGAITALNLLLGWTLIGWVAAFVWSCTHVEAKTPTATVRRPKGDFLPAGWDKPAPTQPEPDETGFGVIPAVGMATLVFVFVVSGLVVWLAPKTMEAVLATKHVDTTAPTVDAEEPPAKWYATTVLEPSQEILRSQREVEKLRSLKAKRDAMALPVAEPPHKKKKWAE